MATPIIFTDREPVVKLADTKPGDSVKVALEASLDGRCPNLADDALTLPDIPAETVPPPVEIDVPKVIERDLARLQKMPGDELFEVTFKSTSDPVFGGTLEFLSGLKKDLADPAAFLEYQKGVHNDALAERFGALLQGSMKIIGAFQGTAAPEQRQYVYAVVRMLAELMISLTVIQGRDLAADSALLVTLLKTVEMISALLEMGVKIDPDGSFAQALGVATAAAKDQPNVLAVLKRFSELM